ncbi:hypothetical protein [Puniceicoccus vermicola]|uniref:Uncharacterized protein n=1 Tax=Puniceicoccus vermicola TaxID=388746 RepID=A0A7X1AVY4_9BACT|nr:hypothetical protein [Puniceicoccus vermicola]MBC2600998.1 hypothetical protein [Puniceicoccus vermicola]
MRLTWLQLLVLTTAMVVSPLSLSALTDSWGFELPEESQTHRQTEIAESAEPASEEAVDASEWGGWGLKTASGDFFGETPEYAGHDWPQTQQPRRENGDRSYDTASDVRNGPNVYTYVVQNPWTFFDPHGLKFNDNTFDSEKDRMRYYEDVKDESSIDSEWFNGLGDTDEERITAYNSRVDKFNSELEKLRSTPFGSAQYEYLKSHKETFTLQFGYGSDGKGSDRSFVSGLAYTIAGMDSFGTQSHEFTHLIQNVANTGESSNGVSKNPALDFILSGIYSENEDWDALIRDRRPLWKEAQSQRSRNIVETEYELITNPPGPLGIDGRTFSPYSLGPVKARAYGSLYTLSPGLKNMGTTSYSDGKSENDRYDFNDAVGTRYDFSDAIRISRNQQFDKNP